MKPAIFLLITLVTTIFTNGQDINKIIKVSEVERIEKTLSADDMKGRRPFTPGIEKAADFISQEFKRSKLDFFAGLTTYRQTFTVYKTKFISAVATINDTAINQDNIIAITTDDTLEINLYSNYTKLKIDSSLDLLKEASRLLKEKKNYIIFVDSSHSKNFSRLKRFKRESFKMNYSVLFVLSNINPVKYNFLIRHEIAESTLSNVAAMIPGKSKPDEYVIFSAHYDHLGIGKVNAEGDSIYNGANDDAAGTTAMIMLADYFNKLKSNERTLLFVAFTAEESGGYGSRYFSTQVNPDKVVAMFNIEMIGTESKWGKNSAYITGFDKSDLGKILQKNLQGSAFTFEPDPYPKQNLFYRSDNATLAALGVPAHTISTSKMDSEKFYHTLDDEFETLDMKNMAEIIKAIAISSKTIINGKDTPARVEIIN
ncbi:MAG: M28 family peptidase [Ferruginibacter sp.]